MEPNQDGTEVLETPVETAVETVETPALTPEEIKSLKEKAAKADELESKNKQLFERLEKSKVKVPSKDNDLSSQDILALSKANLSDAQMEEALDFAKYKKLSVKEALNNPTLKNMLAQIEQDAKNAAASNTGSAQRGSSKVSEQDYLDKALRGEEITTAEGMAGIFKARMAQKLGKKR